MKILEYKNSKIVNIVKLEDGFIILEAQDKYPHLSPNLYKVDLNFKEIWVCKNPWSFIQIRENLLIVRDSYGEGILNPITGEVTHLKVLK